MPQVRCHRTVPRIEQRQDTPVFWHGHTSMKRYWTLLQIIPTRLHRSPTAECLHQSDTLPSNLLTNQNGMRVMQHWGSNTSVLADKLWDSIVFCNSLLVSQYVSFYGFLEGSLQVGSSRKAHWCILYKPTVHGSSLVKILPTFKLAYVKKVLFLSFSEFTAYFTEQKVSTLSTATTVWLKTRIISEQIDHV